MFNPTALNNYLACNYLDVLNRASYQGELTKPFFDDPVAQLMREQGQQHEEQYLKKLKEQYENIVELAYDKNARERQREQTLEAMKNGVDVIYQGALADEQWSGYADFLIKVSSPSNLGEYSYKVEDTKLSTQPKGYAVLQLCIYAELLEKIQGKLPEEITIVCGNNEPYHFNPNDFTSYLRYVKKKFTYNQRINTKAALKELPDPVDYCHICDWRGYCEDNWVKNDHLKLVAGASKIHRKQLKDLDIETLKKLGELPEAPELPQSSDDSSRKIHAQAKIQLKARNNNAKEYEFIDPIIPNQGFAGLPEPNEGDLWFDIEGNPHIHRQGLEYLWGWVTQKNEITDYHTLWSVNSSEEKDALTNFIEYVIDQRKVHPNMHVYHFGHYEASVLRRLSTRHNVLVNEFDQMLRENVFIDLYRIVKNSLRLSVEGYGLKNIEGHYKFERKTDLNEASKARKSLALTLENKLNIEGSIKNTVQDYNEEDCMSTLQLHKWLEELRSKLTCTVEIPRLSIDVKEYEEKLELTELAELSDDLYQLLPEENSELTEEQKALKAVADLLLWYRREDKSHWWEHFRLKELSSSELIDERKALGGPFQYLETLEIEDRSQWHRWQFTKQIFEGKDKGSGLHFANEEMRAIGDYRINLDKRFLDIKFGLSAKDEMVNLINNSVGFFELKYIGPREKIPRLKNLGDYVKERNGIDNTTSEFDNQRNLLLRNQILSDANTTPIRNENEDILDCSIRLCKDLRNGAILPIQGPPGTGKTYTAAHMICNLVKSEKTIGITAQSHAVIRNLFDQVNQVNDQFYQLDFNMVKQKGSGENNDDYPEWLNSSSSAAIEGSNAYQVAGGTAWLWSRIGMQDKVDVLFIDEAGQFALADAIAVAHSSSSMVLLGDPLQLANVTQGVHPPEIELSVLGYWLGENKVMPKEAGLFLDTTYRMHPDINKFISEEFYEGQLSSAENLANQRIIGDKISGSGLRFIPCFSF